MPATTTELFDRYLHAVKFWLPKAHQNDIIAELGEDLRSQMDEREAALGRPLDEADLVAILKHRGAPMRVASGYLPELRLINPAMLPAYRLVLKIVLLWVLGPLFVLVFLGPLLTSAHPERVLLQFWAQAWQTGFMVVGIVTAVFALLDRYHAKIKGFDTWDPRKLPRVPAAHDTASRWNRLAGFIFGLAAAIFWIYVFPHHRDFWFPGGIHVSLAPVWDYIYWPVLVVTLTDASIDLLSFVYPCWTQTRSRVRVGLDAIVILMAGVLLKVEHWVDLAIPNLSHADLTKVMAWVNVSVQVTIIFIAVNAIVDAVRHLRRLRRRKPASPAAILTAS